MDNADNESKLIRRLKLGDERALEEIYDRYGALVHSVALRILRREADAEDVSLQTWLEAWRSAATYDRSQGTVATWVLTIARASALERLRSLGSCATTEATPASESGPHEPAIDGGLPDAEEQRQLSGRVNGALATLGTAERQALELAYFGNLSQPQIANCLDAPLGTVKSWMRNAIAFGPVPPSRVHLLAALGSTVVTRFAAARAALTPAPLPSSTGAGLFA